MFETYLEIAGLFAFCKQKIESSNNKIFAFYVDM